MKVSGDFTLYAVFARTLITNQLDLTVSGAGKVTANFRGNELIQGNSYKVTAVPGAGQLFTGWSGSISSTNLTLKFKMEPGFSLQANFVPNPFLAVTGVYNGLFYQTATRVIHYAREESQSFT